MTVGFYSPLPPERTGVAQHSAALLAALGRRHSIRVNRDGDVNLYHLGNNQLHAPIYKRALERPGIVVLHDAVLHHFALGYFSRQAYVEEFVYNYGEWTRGLAESLWAERARSAGDARFFRYPMLRRIVERSMGVVVHNPAAARIALDHHPAAKVFEIPLLFSDPPLPHAADAERLRPGFGRAFFGVFGHLRESKRLMTVLRVFSRLRECPLLIAGDVASSDLQRAMSVYESLPNLRRIGYMSPDTYWRAALAVDVCINLRYPAAGETSAVSIDFMGVGRPVIMTDSLENSRYPEGACLRVTHGPSEEAELEAFVDWASRCPSDIREIGVNAAAYVREVHSAEHVADLYGRALYVN